MYEAGSRDTGQLEALSLCMSALPNSDKVPGLLSRGLAWPCIHYNCIVLTSSVPVVNALVAGGSKRPDRACLTANYSIIGGKGTYFPSLEDSKTTLNTELKAH